MQAMCATGTTAMPHQTCNHVWHHPCLSAVRGDACVQQVHAAVCHTCCRDHAASSALRALPAAAMHTCSAAQCSGSGDAPE